MAIGDEIGQGLNAHIVLVLIGEWPGPEFSAAWAHPTWAPGAGGRMPSGTVSPIFVPEGLGYQQAAERIFRSLVEARAKADTGVTLKSIFHRLLIWAEAMKISEGKAARLRRLATDKGVIAALAIDQRKSLRHDDRCRSGRAN